MIRPKFLWRSAMGNDTYLYRDIAFNITHLAHFGLDPKTPPNRYPLD